jgi:hypothetical protein
MKSEQTMHEIKAVNAWNFVDYTDFMQMGRHEIWEISCICMKNEAVTNQSGINWLKFEFVAWNFFHEVSATSYYAAENFFWKTFFATFENILMKHIFFCKKR